MDPALIDGLPLPEPAPGELARSRRLADVIRREIEDAGGVIAFSRFMELALYEPAHGYYASGAPKLGAQGDFVTAPELGDLFASCLAVLLAHVLDRSGGGEVMELGAGSGALAAHLLSAMGSRGALPERYLILEISAEMKRRQADALARRVPHCLDRVEWLTTLPSRFDGVVLANEVADALPVDRFCIEGGRARGVGVGIEDGAFCDRLYPVEGPQWDRVNRLGLAEGYRSELGLQAEAWMRALGRCLGSGLVLIVDYGYPASELYHPMRSAGTLMCHYRHRAHADPYRLIGLQDITAHVDFSALAAAACAAGQSVLGFTTQASFLLSLGILDAVRADPSRPDAESLRTTQEVKRLVMPSGMGETFKALAVGADRFAPLPGFGLADHRHRL